MYIICMYSKKTQFILQWRYHADMDFCSSCNDKIWMGKNRILEL